LRLRSPRANGRGDLGDVADLGGEVAGEQVDVVRQVLPGAGHARHHRLAAEPPFGADLARHARHLAGKGAELLDHRVDGLLELQDLAAHVHGDLLRQVAIGDGGRDFRDVAHLSCQVGRHEVDVVGQVLPGARHARHHRLPAEFALGAHFARHARHLAGEGVELVDHRVDGFLQLQDLALDVHGDLAAEVAAGHRRGHLGDVADLARQVARHRIDVVGQVLPRAGDARHVRLAAEAPFRADLARHACHLAGEAVELVHHGVQRLLQLKDLAADIHGDLAAEVAVGDGGRDFRDVAHLVGQVARH
jgi:hypothetical protein